jgi:hypothetical protein
MLNVNPFASHVVARLLDFFSSRIAWQRSLWISGTVLSLREILEASEQVANGVISKSSLENVASWAIIAGGRDAGVGDEDRRKQLQKLLRIDDKGDGLAFNGAQYRSIAILASEIEPTYLERWSNALQAPSAALGPERTARAIASHLLDAGFSSGFLHRWWTFKAKYEPGTKSLSEIVHESHELASRQSRQFETLVAFAQAPSLKVSQEPLPHWLSNRDVSAWLRQQKFDVSGLRQRGGLTLTLEARDPLLVAELAAEIIDRIITRVNLGSPSYNRLVPIEKVWIAGEREPIPLPVRRRRVEVHALQRENRIYEVGEFNIIDAAMELVAPLDAEPPSSAVAGGWAAIEALLTGPGDRERVSAADRMASIVACSFPRAELTSLSYPLEAQGGNIGDQLGACANNRDRCEVLVKLIQAGNAPTFPKGTDTAALARITVLLAKPASTLRDVEGHISTCFRRLYRHRNIVLHGGKTDAVGLRACLRNAAPLVGAGLDRIAHAWFVDRLHPLELAARARLRLDALGTGSGTSALDLLG